MGGGYGRRKIAIVVACDTLTPPQTIVCLILSTGTASLLSGTKRDAMQVDVKVSNQCLPDMRVMSLCYKVPEHRTTSRVWLVKCQAKIRLDQS